MPLIDVCLDNDLASKPFAPFSGRPDQPSVGARGLGSFAVQTSIDEFTRLDVQGQKFTCRGLRLNSLTALPREEAISLLTGERQGLP
jgi:hypothetical protein